MNKFWIIACCLSLICNAQDFTQQWLYTEAFNNENLTDELINTWEYYYLNPINLNDSTKTLLLKELHLLSDTEYKLLIEYCNAYPLQSVYQLQGINIPIETLRRIHKFVVASPTNFTQTQSNKTSVFIGIQAQSPQRVGSQNNAYTGSPLKTHFRYKTHLEKGWNIGVNWEKDSGEPSWYSNEGPNNFAFNLKYQGLGKLKKILVGKYDITIGEGLVFGTSYRINTPYFLSYTPSLVTKESLSSKEYNYFSGMAVNWLLNKSTIDIFISHRKLNGTTSQNQTGLFRTDEEIKHRKSRGENLIGLSISKGFKQNKISWAGFFYHSGFLNSESHFIQSLYFTKNYYNFTYSTEIVLQNLNKWAQLQKLSFSISNNSLISIQYRSRNDSIFTTYRADYSNFSNGYENGVYWCFQHNFNKKWQFKSAFDHFKSNSAEKTTAHLSRGTRFLSEFSRKSENKKLVLQYQNKLVIDLDKISKIKLFYQSQLSSSIKYSTKLQYLFERKYANSNLQVNLYWSSTNKYHKVNLSHSLCNTQSESIYWQAPYFYGSYNSKFLSGKGSINSLSYQKRLNKSTKFGIQLIYLYYADRDEIGTGNERIESNSKLEFTLYLKWLN